MEGNLENGVDLALAPGADVEVPIKDEAVGVDNLKLHALSRERARKGGRIGAAMDFGLIKSAWPALLGNAGLIRAENRSGSNRNGPARQINIRQMNTSDASISSIRNNHSPTISNRASFRASPVMIASILLNTKMTCRDV